MVEIKKPLCAWVPQLTKSDVRTRATQQKVTDAAGLGSRNLFASCLQLESASPARWDHDILMLACVNFNVVPVLGVGGSKRVAEEHGFLLPADAESGVASGPNYAPVGAPIDTTGSPWARYTSSPNIGQLIYQANRTLRENGEDTVAVNPTELSSAAAAFVAKHGRKPTFPEVLEMIRRKRDGQDLLEGTPLETAPDPTMGELEQAREAAAPEELATLEFDPAALPIGVFIEAKLDRDFHITETQKKFLDMVDRMSRKGEPVNVALLGPTGAGKTSMAEYLAATHGRPLHVLDCPTIRETKDLWGFRTIEYDADGKPVVKWHRSAFAQAIAIDYSVVVLDEGTRVHASVLNSLMPVLDHRRRVYIDDLGEEVVVGKGVIFIVTANRGIQYTGTYTWDAAFENRMDYQLEVDYLPVEVESKVLSQKTGVPAKVAQRMAEVATLTRKAVFDEKRPLPRPISTRQNLSACRAIMEGLSPVEALEVTVVPNYSVDGGKESDRAHVLQIIQSKLT